MSFCLSFKIMECSSENSDDKHQGTAVRGDDGVAPTKMAQNGPAENNNAKKRERHHWRRKNLYLEIPSRTLEVSHDMIKVKRPLTSTTPTPKRVSFLLTHSPPSQHYARLRQSEFPHGGSSPSHNNNSSRGGGDGGSSSGRSFKNFVPKLSHMSRNHALCNLDVEKALDAIGGTPISTTPRERTSLSLTKIFTPRSRKALSLPVTPISHTTVESTHGSILHRAPSPHLHTKEAQSCFYRSLSVPVNNKQGQIRRLELSSFIRVVPSPRVKRTVEDVTTSNTTLPAMNKENCENENDGEDIPQEEAVCRICLVELGEGGDAFKMECACKGELALAHKECALKWFRIKGNKMCDICKQEVRNLPVTLLRIQSCHAEHSLANRGQLTELNRYSMVVYSMWQDVPALVIVSMLVYFCFLEQLLVAKMGTGAIAISLPFSCVLVKRRYVWIYAAIQFALVVIFGHLFYSLVHLQAVLSILLSTFAGFGVSMGVSSTMVELIRWWRRLYAHRQQMNMLAYPTLSIMSNQEQDLPWPGFPNHRPADIENPETFSNTL